MSNIRERETDRDRDRERGSTLQDVSMYHYNFLCLQFTRKFVAILCIFIIIVLCVFVT